MDDTQFTNASLHQAETSFQHALLTNDLAALDRLLHEDVRFTGPDGLTIDKATDMAAHQAKAFTLTAVDELNREVQVIDVVGITRTTLHLVGSAGEHDLDLILPTQGYGFHLRMAGRSSPRTAVRVPRRWPDNLHQARNGFPFSHSQRSRPPRTLTE